MRKKKRIFVFVDNDWYIVGPLVVMYYSVSFVYWFYCYCRGCSCSSCGCISVFVLEGIMGKVIHHLQQCRILSWRHPACLRFVTAIVLSLFREHYYFFCFVSVLVLVRECYCLVSWVSLSYLCFVSINILSLFRDGSLGPQVMGPDLTSRPQHLPSASQPITSHRFYLLTFDWPVRALQTSTVFTVFVIVIASAVLIDLSLLLVWCHVIPAAFAVLAVCPVLCSLFDFFVLILLSDSVSSSFRFFFFVVSHYQIPLLFTSFPFP